MRFPESKIKEALLHPEDEVRVTALYYFSNSYSQDASVMPLVIQAAERFGPSKSFRMLRTAHRLNQSPATIDWAVGELRRSYDVTPVVLENHRLAIARLLVNADPELLIKRHTDLSAVMPEEEKLVLEERLALHFQGWPTLWAALEDLGRRTLESQTADLDALSRKTSLLAALARHPQRQEDQVLGLLRRQYKREQRPVMEWMEPWLVELAGSMRLEKAIPVLLKRLGEGCDEVIDEMGPALVQIGSEAVLQAVNRAWRAADWDARISLSEPLENIHCDLAVERCLTFLDQEEDSTIAVALAHAALSHFDPMAIDPVRALLHESGDELDPEELDLRFGLVARCLIMGKTFPEFDAWHEDALEKNWGWGKNNPSRYGYLLTEGQEEEPPADHEEEIPPEKVKVFQLRVVLQDIEPTVWRRIVAPDCCLADLHYILQAAMGWDYCHLYLFEHAGQQYADVEMMDGEWDGGDAAQTLLSEILTGNGQKLTYRYDLGDDWRHDIEVVQVDEQEEGLVIPHCLDGSRACPPEDVGGPPGYAQYLAILADPDHKQHPEMLDWRGEFDPEAFDIEEVNEELRQFGD